MYNGSYLKVYFFEKNNNIVVWLISFYSMLLDITLHPASQLCARCSVSLIHIYTTAGVIHNFRGFRLAIHLHHREYGF